MAEYFGGVLASSRTTNVRDDRGASFIAIVGRLSVYQVRSHYVFYTLMKQLYGGCGLNLTKVKDRTQLQLLVPFPVYDAAMDFSGTENRETLLPHAVFGLVRETLVRDSVKWGEVETLKEHTDDASVPGILVQPSPLGAELFLWAHGVASDVSLNFFEVALSPLTTEEIQIPSGATPVSPRRARRLLLG